MEDLLEQTNEIQETIARSYAVPDEVDEADLEAGRVFPTNTASAANLWPLVELEQLALEVDEEGPTYLADVNRVPDFIDEAPVEASEVGFSCHPQNRSQFSCRGTSLRRPLWGLDMDIRRCCIACKYILYCRSGCTGGYCIQVD